MPQFRKGDIFDSEGIHIVTASSSLSQDGTLVMGLGAAYAMKCRHPRAPKMFGAMINGYCGDCGDYGLLLFGSVGVLQTKRHYNDKVDPSLILFGLRILKVVAEGQPKITFNITYPGMGFGKSRIPEVDKILGELPGNVLIWEKEDADRQR